MGAERCCRRTGCLMFVLSAATMVTLFTAALGFHGLWVPTLCLVWLFVLLTREIAAR